jgi:signal transduction histidine kinase
MNSNDVPVIFIAGTLTLLVFVIFLVLIIIEYSRRQVRHITEKLSLQHQYQQQLLQTQLEVQEQSFRYVSEEIHDNIAQTLSLARLKLFKTTGKIDDENIKSGLESTTELLGNALSDLRNLSHVLNGGLVSKLTLQENIEKELNYASDVKEIRTNLAISGIAFEPNPEKKLLIFRIVQESINNAIRHGEASEVNVSINYAPGQITLSITDNGKGFDIGQVETGKGLGLHNIQLRARLLGNVKITSETGIGTCITLNIHSNE